MNEKLSIEVARNLLKIKAVFLKPNDPFTWASGIKSPIYCDNRLVLSYPEARKVVEAGLAELIKENYPTCEVIMGTSTAGIAHAAYVSDILNMPMGYVRGGAKDHGRGNQIEGVVPVGKDVVVIEDLISTAGSSIEVVNVLRENGSSATALFSMLRDPDVATSYLKNIFFLREIVGLMPLNNETQTEEMQQLLNRLILTPEEIPQEMINQENIATIFKGDLFDTLRKLLSANGKPVSENIAEKFNQIPLAQIKDGGELLKQNATQQTTQAQNSEQNQPAQTTQNTQNNQTAQNTQNAQNGQTQNNPVMTAQPMVEGFIAPKENLQTNQPQEQLQNPNDQVLTNGENQNAVLNQQNPDVPQQLNGLPLPQQTDGNGAVNQMPQNPQMPVNAQQTPVNAQQNVIQEQIKPHFLYNTLNTIGCMAFENSREEVYEAVETMGNFYRKFLSKGNDNITIADEVDIVKSYIKLLRYRYDNLFEDQYYIQEDLKPVVILKLILQPLVENCIYHGIRPKGEKGIIKISIYSIDDKIHIVIYDSGIGMGKDEIAQLMSGQNKKSFGFKGTIDRIRNFYHIKRIEDVVEIRSVEGEYCEIELIIPFPDSNEVTDYV